MPFLRLLSWFIRVLTPIEQRVPAVPVFDDTVVFEFLLAGELNDCCGEIMRVFGITDYARDYENVWEWVEGTIQEGISVNITRPHDWEKGMYEEPVSVLVRRKAARIGDDQVTQWGSQLAHVVGVEVCQGHHKVQPDSDQPHFVVEQRFKPVAGPRG